jgi:hypothetical protein
MRSACTLLLACVLAAHGTASSLELEGPEVITTGWNSGSLAAADIDGDGRTDLALLNNDHARIDVLIQRPAGAPAAERRPAGLDRWKPVLEDARFQLRTVATGSRMYELALGDFDHDGRTDLAFTNSIEGLSIRYQDRRGEFDRSRRFDIDEPATYGSTVDAVDLNSDGRSDLVVLTKLELLVFLQADDGELGEPVAHRLPGECFGLNTVDVDGDGLADLSYQATGDEGSIRVRPGLGAGAFGPELTYRIGATRGIVRPIPAASGRGADFVRIQDNTGQLERLGLVFDDREQTPVGDARPRVFAYPSDGKATAAATLADLDRNGLLDLAVADPRDARIWVFRQVRSGIFSAAEAFPSLTGIRSLVAVDRDGDGRDELIMASPKEQTLAWTRLREDGQLELPAVISVEGRPEAVAAADFDGDGRVDLVYASTEKRERRLFLLSGASDWQDGTRVEVGDLDHDPAALRVADLDQDGRPDLVLFVDHGDLRLLLNDGNGTLTEAVQESGFGRSSLADVKPSAVSLADIDGDGRRELIVANAGFARALRVGSTGELEIVAQLNARSADARIAAAVLVGAAGDPTVVLLEPDKGRGHSVTQRRTAGWGFRGSFELPSVDLAEAAAVDLDGSGTDDLVLFGSDRFVWIPVGLSETVLRPTSAWECDLTGVEYRGIDVGDLDGDGIFEVLAMDSRDSHVVEILRPGDNDLWTSLLHFTVFEVDLHYEGQQGSVHQPREIVVADLTNDGLQDLALVVHDRVLIYPQVAVPQAR